MSKEMQPATKGLIGGVALFLFIIAMAALSGGSGGSSTQSAPQIQTNAHGSVQTATAAPKVAEVMKAPSGADTALVLPDDKDTPEWLKVGNECAARYGLHDGSGRNTKAELDCIDYYYARGKLPPDTQAARKLADAQNNWIQTLCAGVAGRKSLNQAFQTYDSCLACAAFVELSQTEAKRLAAVYGVERN